MADLQETDQKVKKGNVENINRNWGAAGHLITTVMLAAITELNPGTNNQFSAVFHQRTHHPTDKVIRPRTLPVSD